MAEESAYKRGVDARKAALADEIRPELAKLAESCADVWGQLEKIDALLVEAFPRISKSALIYSWDRDNLIVSSMISTVGSDSGWQGRNLTKRPYLVNNLPFKGIMLSKVYQSEYDGSRCVTALQAVNRGNHLLGFIAADFHVDRLLEDSKLEISLSPWKQYRGDPAVRGTLFMQQRAHSRFDSVVDAAFERLHLMIAEYGVFHTKILFSSGRCTMWFYDDPFQYQLLDIDEVIDEDVLLAYPLRSYPARAQISVEQVTQVFKQFKALRFADETVYLRSGSLNIVNAMVGLTFSCDGSHYMSVHEFLDRDMGFWVGEEAAALENTQSK